MTVKSQALDVANKYLENVNNVGRVGIHADVMVRAYVQE